jgi:NAD+ kinase
VEERMMVQAHLIRNGEREGNYDAVNDVVVSRGRLARVIRTHISIDGESLDSFAVDGAIVATATGSTAYSLAAGGPILAPSVRTLLLTLISPYLSPIHSLVLPEGSHVKILVKTSIPAMLTIDGQYDIELMDGDIVETQASGSVARFVRLGGPSQFYQTLIHRLREDGDQ